MYNIYIVRLFFSVVVLLPIIIVVIIYVYVFSTCTGLADKRMRFPQGLSLVLYSHFRIFLSLYC